METTKKGGIALHWLMLIGFVVGLAGGMAVNLLVGADAPWVVWVTSNITGPAGQIFLRLLFMLVIPLLFSALVVGVAEMGDLKSLGRAGIKTLLLTIVVSGIAVVIGLGMVNLFRPGDGVDPALAQQLLAQGREGASAIVEKAPTRWPRAISRPSSRRRAAMTTPLPTTIIPPIFKGLPPTVLI